MSVFHRLIKLLVISLSILLFSILLFINPADAKNLTSGFGAGTTIATPKGDIPVEELKVGDRIIGYNFETHHTEENIIKEINQKPSLSYYLIDNKTKVAGTSFVYVRTAINPQLVRLHQLKIKDKLFTLGQDSIIINSVEQVIEPTNIYQVVLNNSKGNLYADNLLIHVGDEIPAYFKRQLVDCQPGTPYFKQCPNINSASGLLAAIVTILCIPLLGALISIAFIYVKNFIRFRDREFTDNIDLINFTTGINRNFANRYSLKYLEGNKVWYLIPLKPEVSEAEYQHLVKTTELAKQIHYLYSRYHQDLVDQNFSEIILYFTNFAYKRKYKQYREYIRDRFDIIYQPKILELAILDLKLESNRAIFKVQVNAEMVNFVTTQAGYVLTGESKIQQYSEYWYIALTSDKQWCIQDIEATLTTQILSGDKRARKEAYANFTGA